MGAQGGHHPELEQRGDAPRHQAVLARDLGGPAGEGLGDVQVGAPRQPSRDAERLAERCGGLDGPFGGAARPVLVGGLLGPGDRRRGELAGVGGPARAERGVGAQDQRARVARPAGARDVGLRIGPGPGGDGRAGELQAQLGVGVTVQAVQLRGAQREGVGGPADEGQHRDLLGDHRGGRRCPRPGRRRQQVLRAAQRAAGGVAPGQPQQQRHRRVRLARLDEQFGGARLVVGTGALGEHPGHPPGQRRPFRWQQHREHRVPRERVRPAQRRPVGHQQRLPDRGPQGAQHLLLGGAGRGPEQAPVELGAEHGGGVQDRLGRVGERREPVGDERGERGRDRRARSGDELLDREGQPVRAQQQALGLLVGDRPAAPARRGQRRHVPPVQPAQVQGDRSGCGGEAARGVGRGVVAGGAGQQDGRVGGGAREVLDQGERVVVGPVQVLQAQHAAGRVAQREAQQPEQALGEDDDGVRAQRRADPAVRFRPAGQQPGERGAVGAQLGVPGPGRVVEEADHRAGDRPERPPALHRPAGQHGQPALRGPPGHLVEQAGLPDPGLPGDEQRATPPGGDGVDQPAGGRELGAAADQDGAAGHPAGTGRTGDGVHALSTPVPAGARKCADAQLCRSQTSRDSRARGAASRRSLRARESGTCAARCADRSASLRRRRVGRGVGHPGPVPALRTGIGHPCLMSSRRPDPAPPAAGPSLAEILGGRGGALDASAAPVAFVAGFGIADAAGSPSALLWGGAAALGAALATGAVRLMRGKRPAAVLAGLLGVAVAVLVALYTGRAVDFFLLQIASNAASALAWAVSIVVRWPLLGLVVGTALGQRTRWRRDPDLLRGYRRASGVWVAQYLVRLAVFVPLYLAGAVYALGIARVALTWPLVVACIALSWPVLRRALPPGHPGLLHPRVPGAAGGPPYSGTGHEE